MPDPALFPGASFVSMVSFSFMVLTFLFCDRSDNGGQEVYEPGLGAPEPVQDVLLAVEIGLAGRRGGVAPVHLEPVDVFAHEDQHAAEGMAEAVGGKAPFPHQHTVEAELRILTGKEGRYEAVPDQGAEAVPVYGVGHGAAAAVHEQGIDLQ